MLERRLPEPLQEIKDLICPVCGYYCNGKGGKGCIDKIAMYEREAKKMNEPPEKENYGR